MSVVLTTGNVTFKNKTMNIHSKEKENKQATRNKKEHKKK